MPKGPFSGPRPFAGASLVVSFTYNNDVDKTDLEIEQRLRRNGFPRADVQKESMGSDTRTQVRVITNEERLSYSSVLRVVGQVRNEVEQDISENRIEFYCT